MLNFYFVRHTWTCDEYFGVMQGILPKFLNRSILTFYIVLYFLEAEKQLDVHLFYLA